MFEDWSQAHVVTTEREMEFAKKNVVRFFLKPRLDKKASEEAGEPRYKDEEYIEIITGDRTNVPQKPLRNYPKLKRLYADKYAAWKAGTLEAMNGKPLEQVRGVLPSHVEELRYHHIRTREQFAEISDEILSRLGPGYRELQTLVRKDILREKENFAQETVKAEMAKKDSVIDALTKRLEALELAAHGVPAPAVTETKKPKKTKEAEQGD